MSSQFRLLDDLQQKIIELRLILEKESDTFKGTESVEAIFLARAARKTREYISSYGAIAAGCRIGFEGGAEVRAHIADKYDFHISPPRFDSYLILEVDDIKGSSFLSLEFDLTDNCWRNAKGFQFFISGLSTWGLRGELVLREFSPDVNDGHKDTPLTKFEIGEARSSDSRYVSVDLQNDDQFSAAEAKLLVFLEPRNFRSEIHFISAVFNAN